ncbi:ABC transporter substrate-binding protein [Paenibacillus sp. UMB4589-SE434]|uniref:ABC transporter substrate-binding protein n=1 Tax=Paenibacillus sp. UMB4589-SE434 TaxID=3046314 RepID=UPI00254B15CA|nr:ABC transporter substrate-binding protein [Paenibacillus sp. UMB4589-SE434]MDK8181128.1 ABC transporter substrate-binding protein [Paenibacillus sp. UMB4589-SE434]
MKKRLLTVLSLVLAFSLVLTACGGGDSAEGNKTPDSGQTTDSGKETTGEGELVTEGVIPAPDASLNPEAAVNRKDTAILGITDPSGIFNPLYAESTYDVYLVESIFAQLLTINKDGTFSPFLADYKVSDDNKTFTFTLKDAKFSDGKPVTAEDVAFTITAMYDKDYDGPQDVMQYAPLVGAKEYKEGKANSITGIKVIDPKTIEFTNTEVRVTALNVFGATGIMPKHVYGAAYKQGNMSGMKDLFAKPVGAGAYKLDKYLPGQEVRLVANENYFMGAPKIKNLIYKTTTEETRMQLLQTGETDYDDPSVSKDQMEEIKNIGFLDSVLNPTNGYGYIAFNNTDPKFADKKVRQALTFGLDRKQIVDTVYQGYADVVNIPQSKVSWAYTDEVEKYEFNLDKAKTLLDEAGWKVGADGIREKDGKKFKINFSATTPNVVNEAIIPIAQKNYKDLGIEFVADQMDFNAMLDKYNKKNYDMLFLAAGLTPDPQDSEGTFRTGGSQNKTGYSNPKVDELLKKSGSTLNVEERKGIFKEIYQQINEDLPMMFVYQRRDLHTINHRIQGFDISPYRRFTNDLATIQIQ